MNFEIIYINDLLEKIRVKNRILIDIRERQLFEQGHINGAINYPLEETDFEQLLSKEEYYVFYCEHGSNSIKLARYLGRRGYKTATLIGGYEVAKTSKKMSKSI